ncbi:helix-turn-helix domain-containing protein [Lysinibacillus antri]|uniref:XRE family transcriptional regulator n=1 Tax=Lysinibacillus antri TaxID=2498145 RepID=A0A3S0R3P2_9BACI|nr:helix-turn-helix transcriptional regulator [Lysinibacillus antri]RUL46534.1 XRE family transcriptional regulator [Lysinibacillus antri]
MDYEKISDTLLLDYKTLKVALYEECKSLFEDYPILLDLWKQDAYTTSELEIERQAPDHLLSDSFTDLYKLFTESLYSNYKLTKRLIKFAVENYRDSIIESQMGHIQSLVVPNQDEKNDLKTLKTIADQEYIYTNAGTEYHLMRDIVTKKSDFSEKDTGYLGAELVDNQGLLHGFAELRPVPLIPSKGDEDQAYWLDLVETTLNSLDELTADIFDLISYLWMTSEKDSEGFINFHSDDALMLRYSDKSVPPEELKFKERDRFNIMRRVAALTSVWVALSDGSERVKIVNTKDLEKDKLYNFQDYKRMFEVGSVRIAFDKKSDEPKGIYSLQIKPSSLLQPYLDGTKSSLGVLDLKVFQYSHFKQREHKRLTRYLSRQFKIRSIRNTIQQPFKISTLLKEMHLAKRLNGSQIRDKFEEVLDDLMRDNVIEQWYYNEEIDESKVGKHGWINKYWGNITVTIMPPSEIVNENKRLRNGKILPTPIQPNHRISEATNSIQDADFIEVSLSAGTTQQEAFVFDIPDNVIELSPEAMKQRITILGYSVRKAAEEMGISHSTLSRYINNKTKRQNKENDQKMIHWLTMNS